MTKKHFIALAKTLAAAKAEIPADAFDRLVANIASDCKAANSAFDTARFTRAANGDK